MLVVDPWHWLNEDGSLPTEDRRLRKQILRVVQLIEAGGTLPRLHAKETTLPCSKRPKRRPCLGLVWVIKTADDRIHAHCPVCRGDEAMIDNWQATDWAHGHLADAFIHLGDDKAVRRFFDLVFSCPTTTPSHDEYAMFMAFSAALRSADLSRQVGAVVCTAHDDIIAVGANDVPRAGGGLHWPGPRDDRDHKWGHDSNQDLRQQVVDEILDRLRPVQEAPAKWRAWAHAKLDGLPVENADEIIERLHPQGPDENEWRTSGWRSLATAKVMDITEYGRAVHAEMEALMACARAGLSPRGGTLFSTTFPCHNCAKHIVAAGIRRVVYVEPYPKSYAEELYPKEISVGPPEAKDTRVVFEPFEGIGPRRFFDLFSMSLSAGYPVKRKDKATGRVRKWQPPSAEARVAMLPTSYIFREAAAADKLLDLAGKKDGDEDEG